MPAGPSDSLYFSEQFRVSPRTLADYGAFDISVVSDLPLFIDPFLLFQSDKPEYAALHEGIAAYLRFLRDRSPDGLDDDAMRTYYRFKEVKQNWLGFSLFGNEGQPLGPKFAENLHGALDAILPQPGDVARSTHIEKLLLLRTGVGRDSISDFTTQLIKHYLLEYTQTFAKEHLDANSCSPFHVTRAVFDPETGSWDSRRYYLPNLRGDYVLLTPADLLTRDETWINYADLVRRFRTVHAAVTDEDLGARIDKRLAKLLKKTPTPKQRAEAAAVVVREFPELADVYIRMREDAGAQAVESSAEKTQQTYEVLVALVQRTVADLEAKTDFYDLAWDTAETCRARALVLKEYVEKRGGAALLSEVGRVRETDVALFFGLVWCRTDFDVHRDSDDERAVVDVRASFGSGAAGLVSFTLAKSSGLKRRLQKAGRASGAVTVVLAYAADELASAAAIVAEVTSDGSVVLVDAS